MSSAGRAAWGLLFALACAPAVARECGEGSARGGTAVMGDALNVYECAVLARVYCRLAEDRDAGVASEDAVRRTADWLDGLNRTGSHRKSNAGAILDIAAGDVYRNKERRPGPTYYRAGYGCGLVMRTGDAPKERQQEASRQFEVAADRCEKQHAMTGARSYPNRPLRNCLANAVDAIAPPGPR